MDIPWRSRCVELYIWQLLGIELEPVKTAILSASAERRGAIVRICNVLCPREKVCCVPNNDQTSSSSKL